MDFTLNQNIFFCVVAVIPVILWFVNTKKSVKTLLIGSIFILIFTRGSFELIGISSSLTRILVELTFVFLFLYKLLTLKKYRPKAPGFKWILIFLIISTFSIYVNPKYSLTHLLLFSKEYLMLFLIIFVFSNSKFKQWEYYKIDELISYLFISQIFASLIKLIILKEPSEPYIGTMANVGGSQTTIFALIGSSYSILHFLYTKKPKFLLLTLLFLTFSVIGGKRATIFYFPIIYFLILYFFTKNYQIKLSYFYKQLVRAIIILPVIGYIMVILSPTLNKENKVGGSFNIDYVIEYSSGYITGDRYDTDFISRGDAPAYLFSKLYNISPVTFLIGNGAGHLVKSKFNQDVIGKTSDEITESKYGVAYGARTSFLQIFLQVGLLGVISFLLIIISIIRAVKKLKNNSNETTFYKIFTLVCLMIYLIDFLTYSNVLTTTSTMGICFAWIISMNFRPIKP